MTLRLLHVLLGSWWDLDGYAAAHGMPELRDMSLARLCSFIWYMLTHNRDEAEVGRVESRLWKPPPGADVPVESPWSAESEMAAFAAAKASLTG